MEEAADSRTTTARALRILEAIQLDPGVSADALAARTGMSDRAVRRHVATLRDAGMPIESSPGRYGGYWLGRGGDRPPPLVFTRLETLGLVMAVLDGHHAAADDADPAGAAVGKLIASLPETIARSAATVRRHARAAPDPYAARPDAAITATLVDAIAGHRRLALRYRTAAGHERTFEVDPWAVVVRHGRWYLACHSLDVGAERSYRVDRIVGAEAMAVGIVHAPPDDFDPVDWLDRHLGQGWPLRTHVEFDAPAAVVRPWLPTAAGTLESSADGRSCVLRGTTNNPTMYAGEWLAAIDVPLRVIGGDELRAAVARLAGRLGDALT